MYNKVYFSNIDIGLMLYIETIIFIYRYAIVNTEGIEQIIKDNDNHGQKFNKINASNN
jgi:hypothetical protein